MVPNFNWNLKLVDVWLYACLRILISQHTNLSMILHPLQHIDIKTYKKHIDTTILWYKNYLHNYVHIVIFSHKHYYKLNNYLYFDFYNFEMYSKHYVFFFQLMLFVSTNMYVYNKFLIWSFKCKHVFPIINMDSLLNKHTRASLTHFVEQYSGIFFLLFCLLLEQCGGYSVWMMASKRIVVLVCLHAS